MPKCSGNILKCINPDVHEAFGLKVLRKFCSTEKTEWSDEGTVTFFKVINEKSASCAGLGV